MSDAIEGGISGAIEEIIGNLVTVAVLGYITARMVPPAPPLGSPLKLDLNPFRASWKLISATMHIPRLFLAICAISFFWTIGSVLVVIFPPLVKNVLTADERVASLFIAVFSVGVAIGSIVINTMLKGRISARYAPASVVAMGVFVVIFSLLVRTWDPAPAGQLYDWTAFIAQPRAALVLIVLLAIAAGIIMGGIVGALVAVPIVAVLNAVTHHIVEDDPPLEDVEDLLAPAERSAVEREVEEHADDLREDGSELTNPDVSR